MDRRVVRVLPDVPAIDKEFDYTVAADAPVQIGDVVRIDLHGRRVGGWIVALDPEPAPGVELRPVARISGRGPSPDLIELASWAAWRWAGRRATLLRTAAPPAVVRALPSPRPVPAPLVPPPSETIGRALADPLAVLRLAPAADRYPLVLAAARAASPIPGGRTLILCPSVGEARTLGLRLRRDGVGTAVVASDRPGAAAAAEWACAAAGAVVVGARAAAWAPVAPLGRVVVLDEHDEAYQEQSSPTWHARDVVVERARRAGAPCLLVSPTPSLEALALTEALVEPVSVERRGWPRIEVVDMGEQDPADGPLFSRPLVDLVRAPGRVLCILNRTGRARLLACRSCTELARCETCDAAVAQSGDGLAAAALRCPRCGTERPAICLHCGGSSFKALRIGVSRAREELEALIGEPVGEVTSARGVEDDASTVDARVLLGTEALLHRAGRSDAVAFLDFDQELLAPRYRAGEEALALLARAARLVRRRGGGLGRVLVQTRVPGHPVLEAGRRRDPGVLVEAERTVRAAARLPPSVALALVSGAAADEFVAALPPAAGLEVAGPRDGTWLLRAPDHQVLCASLAATPRPPGRLRIEVDPLRA